MPNRKFRFPISYQFFTGFFFFGLLLSALVGVSVFLFAYNTYYQRFKFEKQLLTTLTASLASGNLHSSWANKNKLESLEYKKFTQFIQEIVQKDRNIDYLFTIILNEKTSQFYYTASGTISQADTIWIENWQTGFSIIKNRDTNQWELFLKGTALSNPSNFSNELGYFSWTKNKNQELLLSYAANKKEQEKGIITEILLFQNEKPFIEKEKVFLNNENSGPYYLYVKNQTDPLQIVFTAKGNPDIIPGSQFYNQLEFKNELLKLLQEERDAFTSEFAKLNFGDFLISTSIIRDSSKKPIGHVVLKITKANLKEFRAKLIRQIFSASIISIPALILLVYFFSILFYNPIYTLQKFAISFSKGNFEHQIQFKRNDEFSDLGYSMNLMARELNESKIRLEGYAESLEKEVSLRTIELENTLKEIRKDLNTAKKIQMATLPDLEKLNSILEIKSLFIPMTEVGGDIFDIHMVHSNLMRFFIADATGHGVQAALITMAIRTQYENIKNWEVPPNAILSALNDSFMQSYEFLKTYFTAGILDLYLDSNIIQYSGGGHPYPRIIHPDGSLETMDAKGKILGAFPDLQFKIKEATLEPGSSLFLFTDGLFEEWNDLYEEFGTERIETILIRERQKSILEILDSLMEELQLFQGKQATHDDITIVGIRRSM